ncbi:hypothetical protein IWQ62_003040, partial [Dispira parvispora]
MSYSGLDVFEFMTNKTTSDSTKSTILQHFMRFASMDGRLFVLVLSLTFILVLLRLTLVLVLVLALALAMLPHLLALTLMHADRITADE